MADLTTYPVSPNYWKSAKRKKWDADTKNLGMYFLSCDHRNLEGLYYLPKPYIVADLDWTFDQLADPFERLVQEGFVMYDEEAEVILLPKALKFRRPNTDNHMKGAATALGLTPDTFLWAQFLVGAREYAPKFFNFLGGEAELQKYTVHNPSEWLDSERQEAA